MYNIRMAKSRTRRVFQIILALVTPVLFSLFPIISIKSHNALDIPPNDALRPAVIAITATAVTMVIFWFVSRNLHKTSAATSLTLLLFFSYGHVFGGFLDPLTYTFFNRVGLIGNHVPLMMLWVSIWLFGLWVIHRINKTYTQITSFLAILAIVAIAQPGYKILRTELLLRQDWPVKTDTATPGTASLSAGGNPLPDIYYVILDGYARADILKQVFDYDNELFLDFLETEGFYVADQSRSNYGQSSLSLASSLNFNYLNDYVTGVDKSSSDRLPLARLIRHSRVRKMLEASDYRFVNLSSGYRTTELEDADQYLAPSGGETTSMDRLLIDTSFLFALRDTAASLGLKVIPAGFEAHRQRIEFAFDSLPRLALQPGPKFVFVHIIAPHPPFVFGSEGEPVYDEYPFNLLDGDAFPGTRESYARGYVDQLIYINHRLQEVIPALKKANPTPPIIIMQADHGPGMGLVWNSVYESDLDERFSILNAYYLPGADATLLYESITPVNTFRLLFNLYFGMEYPLLNDEFMFATWDQPYDFIPLTLRDGKLVSNP